MSFFKVGRYGLIISLTAASFTDFAASYVLPTIVTQPTNQSAASGSTATFTASAMNGIPLAIRQWFKKPVGSVGAAPAPIQTSPVGNAEWSAATVTFPSPVTAGNTIVVFGVVGDVTPAAGLSTNRSDVFTHSVGSRAGTFLSYATAVGGSTTITINGGSTHRFVAQEWSGLVIDPSAGVGEAGSSGAVAPATPFSSSVASSVSFSAYGVSAGGSYAAQTVPTGYTEVGRATSGGLQFIGAYKVETTTGVKTASWSDPGIYPDDRSAIIAVFNASSSPVPSEWETVPGATSQNYTTPTLVSGDDGVKFRFTDTNELGSVTSNEVTLTVT